jgi:hypothetical protein
VLGICLTVVLGTTVGRGRGGPALVHFPDEGLLFRFRDGRFAFSCENADWKLLRKRGAAEGMGVDRRTRLGYPAAHRAERSSAAFELLLRVRRGLGARGIVKTPQGSPSRRG